MEIKLAEQIKALRKEKGLTQENLAERLGVTVGAVHKWERGRSTPDLHYILDMADLFGVSTDTLLGYAWQSGSLPDLLDEIDALCEGKQYAEAIEQAERALKKFPNHFALVYRAGLCYRGWCETYEHHGQDPTGEAKAHARGVALLSHALELLPQNTDPEISAFTIQTEIAALHQACLQIACAIAVLDRCSINGIHDAKIGHLYANFLHDDEKARPYLSRAYAHLLDDLESVLVGIANLYYRKGDTEQAISTLHWLRTSLRGIQPPDTLTDFDRYDAYLNRTIAILCADRGDLEAAAAHLREALTRALAYDAAKAAGQLQPMRVYDVLLDRWRPKYDVYHTGMTALEMIDTEIPADTKIPQLRAIWENLKQEAGLS